MNRISFLILLLLHEEVFANMQQDIKLSDNRLDLSESWFTIAFFIVFPILIGILYFFLKKKQAKEADAEDSVSQSK
jgi:Mn2+/Fe2+ NRAMP family transporter